MTKKNTYNLETLSNNFEDSKKEIISKIDTILLEMKNTYNNRVIVISVDTIKDNYISKREYYIFNGFLEATEFINSEMYCKDHYLDCFEFDLENNLYVRIMSKTSDSFNFFRLAQIKSKNLKDDKFVFRVREIFDIPTEVIFC